jgi:hypothetical protein
MTDDKMTAAYIEALYFTETGDEDQPTRDAELHVDCKREAWSACHRLRLACSGHDGLDLGQNARILTLMARAMGEHYANFED